MFVTEKLVPIIMCVFFCLFFYVLYRIVRGIATDIMRKKLRTDSRLDKKSVQALLCTYFNPKYVLTNVMLPRYEADKKTYTVSDAIIVTRYCIAVLTIERRFGRINCAQPDIWSQSYKENGVPRLENFENPVPKNEFCAESVAQLFAKKHVDAPEIRNFVMFSTDRISFEYDNEKLYSLSYGIRAVKRDRLHGRYSNAERKKYLSMIKSCAAACRRDASARRNTGR